MMMTAVEKLVTLGLTEHEATTYLILLMDGPATIDQVTVCANVSQTLALRALKSLERRGAASCVGKDGSRHIYTAVPADVFLERLRRERHELVVALKNNLISGNRRV